MALLRVARTKRLFEGRRALAAVGAACLVFLVLGVLVRYAGLQALDLRVTRELQERSLPGLLPLMVGLTYAGSPAVVPVLGVLAALALWRRRLDRAAGLVLGSLLAIPLNVVLKLLYDRARPDAEAVQVAVRTAGTSFPSGHAMGATAFYGALATLAWVHLDARRLRLPIVATLAAMPVMIDLSRVYLGAHWLSDVVAGSAVGLLVLIPLVRAYLRAIPEEVREQAAEGEL